MTNRFTVRIELHGVRSDSEYYERLHEKMEDAGFDRHIETESNRKLSLPTAEYRYFSSTLTNKQVMDKAYDIANAVKRNPSVISTEGAIAFRGLEEI